MNQPTGWGQPTGAWGQPAPAAPQAPQAPQGAPQAGPPAGYPQQPPPQGPPGYPMQPPPGYPPQAPPAPPGGFGQPQAPNYGVNPFAGLTSGDQTANRHPYLEDGDYKLKISLIKAKPARSGKLLFIIETEILESNNPSRPAGMTCASFIDMSNRDLAGRHLAAFVTAVHGYDPVQLPKDSPTAPWVEQAMGRQMQWGEYAVHASHDTNPWAGREVGCTVNTIETKAGNDFGLHTWKPAKTMVIGPMRAAAMPAAMPQMPGAPAWPAAAAPQMPAGQPAWPAPAVPPPAAGWGTPGR